MRCQQLRFRFLVMISVWQYLLLSLVNTDAAVNDWMERYSFLLTCDNKTTIVPTLSNRTMLGALQLWENNLIRCDTMRGASWMGPIPAIKNTSRVQSQHDLKGLFPAYFSTSIWMSPSTKDLMRIQSILAFANEHQPSWSGRCPGYEFRVAQQNTSLIVSFTDQDGFCRHLVMRQYTLELGVLTNILVQFDQTSLSVFVNGDKIVNGAPKTINATSWNHRVALNVFGNGDKVFLGNVLQIDMYKEMTQDEIVQTYQQGLYYPSPHMEPVLIVRPPSPQSIQIPQDSVQPVSIPLLSWNRTGSVYQLAIQILSLPQFGSLWYINSAGPYQAVHVNETFRFAGNDTGLTVQYHLLLSDFFNVPEKNAHGSSLHSMSESLDYRVVALDSKDSVISVSDIASVPIHVVHVNHIPTLSVPARASLVDASIGLYAIVGIQISDPFDLDIDYVRVYLSAKNGQLSLSPTNLELADFDTCRYRTLSSWQCVGDGNQDRIMSFIGIPSDIPYILRNLQYSSFVPGMNDTVVVSLYDGAGGQCLHQEEHNAYHAKLKNSFPTIHRGCFEVNATILVPGYSKKSGSTPRDTSDPNVHIAGAPENALMESLFWGGVAVLVLMCVLGCCRVPRCMARGKAVVPD